MKRESKPSVKYQEGDWFVVPLNGTGYALGLAARVSIRYNIIAGYFFPPRYNTMPLIENIRTLNAGSAILIGLVSHLGFRQGDWKIIHRPNKWYREEWPLPSFVSIDAVDPSLAYRRQYNEDNLVHMVKEEKIALAEAKNYFSDGLYGYKAMEIYLNSLL